MSEKITKEYLHELLYKVVEIDNQSVEKYNSLIVNAESDVDILFSHLEFLRTRSHNTAKLLKDAFTG